MFNLQKKETPISNIAFMAIMAAINVVFAILMAFIPYIMFILVLILPMTSVLVALYCQKRYYPLYIIVTIGLCFISAIWDISITIFYIIPSMITGFLFALFVQLKLPNIWLIAIPSLIQIGFDYLGLYLSYLITGINLIETIQMALKLQDNQLFNVIVPSAIMTISIIQYLFSYMIIKDEIKKFGYDLDNQKPLFLASVITSFILLILTLVFGLFDTTLSVSYLCLVLESLFALELCINSCINKSKLMIILNSVTAGIVLILFGVLYQYLPQGKQFLIFASFYLATTIYAIINYCLYKSNKVDKI